jgi:hypothetical protein
LGAGADARVRKQADKSWLLIKHRDRFATAKEVTEENPRSVLNKRLLADIARDEGGDVEKASTGDTAARSKKKPIRRTVRNTTSKKRGPK